ncbi:hypothetical protein BH09PSE2_BH09PSE2_03590 [soil metagenome]
MSGLSADKAAALVHMVRSLPDGRLRTLRDALASQAPGGWADPVLRAAEAETADRRLRDSVLYEFAALCGPREVASRFPVARFVAAAVWETLKITAPGRIAASAQAVAAREPALFDPASLALVEIAAAGLLAGEGAFGPLAAKLEASPGGADRVTRYLRLVPIARAALPRATSWLKRAGQEDVSALSLALSDASALCQDGGPLLIELLSSAFADRWTALRLSSALMDKPSEVFMAGSEFAGFAEAVLDQVDEAVTMVRDFDGTRGREGGAAVAAATERAIDGLSELEHWVQLDREKPWGRRTAAQRRALSLAAEARLKEAENALALALPIQSFRPGMKAVRGRPRLGAPADLMAVARAEALLTYVDETRRAAMKGGFGTLRGKVVEALDTRLSTYVDDLLDMLHTPDPDVTPEMTDEMRERLELAADLLGLVRDAGATQIVRRRMAAAA